MKISTGKFILYFKPIAVATIVVMPITGKEVRIKEVVTIAAS